MMTGVTPIRFEWRDGFVAKVDAEVAGKELERIAKRDSELLPFTVVEESRRPDAPLHNQFEWDDETAGQLYREDQAKELIRAIKVVYVRNDTEDPLPPMRAYVSVIDTPGLESFDTVTPRARHYRPVLKVMSAEDLRDQYRRQAFDTLCAWRDRYQDIEDFARIFQEIDALKERYAA